MKNFGDRLKKLRNEKGMLQRELADLLRVSRVTITQYENGKRSPDQDTIRELSKIFNTTTDYLLGNSDIRNPYKEEPHFPDEFTTPEEAVEFLLEQNVIMGFGGFDIDKLSDDEKVEFANSLLEHLKLLSLKYKK